MRTTFKNLALIAALVGVSISAQAQEEEKVRDLGKVVVTGTKFETPIEKSGKVIYKITADQITRMAGRTVADILNLMPGLNVDGAYGTPGTNLDYSIRGGRNRQTLILIDGLPINDPSSISNDYDLRLLNANAVEYIEVLKGSASTLYGTGAAAGVINIKMKEATTETPEVTVSQSVGSFRSANTSADVQGKSGKLSYLASGSYAISEGISAAEDTNPNIDFGNDGFNRYSGRTKLRYGFSDDFSLGANFSYERVKADYDDGAFLDADNQFNIRQVSYGINPRLNHGLGSLELKLNFNRVKREFVSAFPSSAKGKNLQGDLINQFNLSDNVKLIAGVQYQQFKFETSTDEPDVTNFDPYINLSADVFSGLTFNAGVRLNNHSEYGNNFIYSVNPSYLIDLGSENKLKFFTSYSTAFVAPSLFQLFADFFGNADLEAEETESLEFGFSLYLSDKLTLNAEYFDRTEENAIDFVSQFDNMGNFIGGGYANVAGKREIDGVEFDLNWQVSEPLRITAHYASYNFGNPAQFYRIPDQKYGLSAQYAIKEGTVIGLTHNHFGDREAAIFSDPFLVTLDGYDIVDLTISHEIFDGKLIFTGAINNLFDEDFVGVYGFNTRPANFNLGVTARF